MTKPHFNTSLALNEQQYIPIGHEKRAIFLHHTVSSNARGSLEWWRKTPQRIGTAFVIDRDGSIFQAFPEECWASHLGIHEDKDKYWEQHSIGIELVAMGPIMKVDKEFRFFPVWPNKTISKVVDPAEVVKLEKPFRTFGYFHTYSELQLKALGELLNYLIEKHKIVLQDSPELFWEYNPKVIFSKLPGIWSHTTVRKDKSDIWPDPNLIKVIEGLWPKKSLSPRKLKK